MLNLKAIS